MNNDVLKLAQIIWDFMLMHQKVEQSDAILALGSHDLRVADRAAELYLQGFAPIIIFSGGVGLLTHDIFNKPEAEVFADRAVALRVPKDKIIIENKSTNTGENLIFTKKILDEKKLNFSKLIVVQKPYMEKRTYATMKKVWPKQDFIVTSPQVGMKEFLSGPIDAEYVIDVMVGDLQRISEYPKKGFTIKQNIPRDVFSAYQKLVDLGYNKHLIKE